MTTSPASSASAELVQRVTANLADVRRRVRASGRSIEDVRVVAVTKTFGPEVVLAALAAGLSTIGENYVEELCEKRRAVADPAVRWHLLGALQSNKIARAVACADVLCAVSREKEVSLIARHRPAMAVYVQVDFTGAAGRSGAPASKVGGLVARARDAGLDVRGLMTVAPIERAAARAAFLATSALADELAITERSMGMSDDLEIALECGTSELRLGRALFGPREPSTATQ